MRRILICMPLLLAGAAVHAAPPSSSPCTDAPRAQWLSDEQLLSEVKRMGYKLKRYEQERQCVEVEGWDRNGQRVALRVDPATARIVQTTFK